MQIAVLILGAVFAAAGIVLFARMGTGGENTIKILGAEFKLAGSALVIFVLGCVLIILAVNGPGGGKASGPVLTSSPAVSQNPVPSNPVSPPPLSPDPPPTLAHLVDTQKASGHAVGIDISSQDQVDWSRLSKGSFSFAIMNATEGAQGVDTQFGRNWPQAKAAGVIRGAYHYFFASQGAEDQANHFLQTAVIQPGDLPPILAVAEPPQGVPPASDAVLEQGIRVWLQRVELVTGRKPIIFTTKRFWDAHIRGDFSAYDLWLGGPNEDAPEDASAQEYLPQGWKSWTFWQYPRASTVDGVQRPASTDLFHGSAQDLHAYAQP